MPARSLASRAATVALRLGSWESPVTVTQNTLAAWIASMSSSSGWISRSGALGQR
jgi:hypothetical protein